MCGVFGFVQTDSNRRVDLSRLRNIARVTETRGHHAFGLIWLDQQGTVHTWKQPGSATQHLDQLDACADAAVIIGHCRWATHGSFEDNRNNHPHVAWNHGWYVHNGVVHNHDELTRRFTLTRKTECDTEVLGLLLGKFKGTLTARAVATINEVHGPLVMLGLWAKKRQVLLARSGNPLCYARHHEGLYLASLATGLGANVKTFPEDTVEVLDLARIHATAATA